MTVKRRAPRGLSIQRSAHLEVRQQADTDQSIARAWLRNALREARRKGQREIRVSLELAQVVTQ
jgi:hypothetical protein